MCYLQEERIFIFHLIKRPSPNPIETRYFFTTLCFDKIQSATFFRSTEVCTFVRVHTHSLLNYMQMMHSFMIQDTVSCLFLHFRLFSIYEISAMRQLRQSTSSTNTNYFSPFTTNIGSPEFILATAPAVLAQANALLGSFIISCTDGRSGVSTGGILISSASIELQSAA